MNTLVQGKVAVVTGGSSGVGRAIATTFAKHGAAGIVIVDTQRTPREGGGPTDAITAECGARSIFVEADVSNPAQLAGAFSAAQGLGGLDVLVNNAGLYLRKDLADTGEDDLDRLLSVNVKGVYFGCQLAADAMRTTGGVIVNLSSVAAYRGSGGSSAYGATKGAVRSLTYGLARELAPSKIRVNAIHPGAVETEMIRNVDSSAFSQTYPWGPATAQDVANTALFLSSELSSHISGASLTVDGAASCMG